MRKQFGLAVLAASLACASGPASAYTTFVRVPRQPVGRGQRLCAPSVAAAVFVILDMDRPYGGLFGVPSESMRTALTDMMR